MTDYVINDPLGDMCAGLDWLQRQTLPAQVQLSIAKDRAISEALSLIQPLWTKEEISRRCVLLRSVGDETETLHVDGVPVVVFYPGEVHQEWKDDRLIITYTQKYKRVRAARLSEAAN